MDQTSVSKRPRRKRHSGVRNESRVKHGKIVAAVNEDFRGRQGRVAPWIIYTVSTVDDRFECGW